MYKQISFFNSSPIASYNVLIGVGIIVFFLILEKLFKKYEIPFQLRDSVYSTVLFAAFFGAIGATLLEALYHRKNGSIVFSGFTFYGGFIFCLLGLLIYSRIRKMNFWYLTNLLILPFSLAHAFGRIGCFLGGCCYGLPTNSDLGVTFPVDSLPYKYYMDSHLHPTQLYESIALMLLFLLLFKVKFEHQFMTYLLIYPSLRFVLEFYRGDNRGVLLTEFLSPSQEISLILFLLGLFLFLSKKYSTQSFV
jgi:phosphatidylglycerol---prolipoprotein diacylglyceryl transferase